MSHNSVEQHESRPKSLENRSLRLESLEQRWLCAANFLGLVDATLAGYVKSLDADGSINRSDMIGILRKVQAEADRLVDATDLGDLRKIVQNASTLKMPNYVSVLASNVVKGNTANAHYQGAALGNLAAGNANAKLGKLVDKWFYGADLPSTGGYAYATASGSLYGAAGPSRADEKQGRLGDCYLIAGLGSIADSSQTAIKNMFIVNGDGTWTVRFYYYGAADYVTVNSKLPVSGANLVFDGYGSKAASASNSLWLPLLEKAYAQWNETGRTWQGNSNNSYQAIEGGWMGDVYQQAMGYATNYCGSTSGSAAKTTLISALAGRQAVTLGTVNYPNFNSTGLYGNHAYNVFAYSGSTGKFTLYNPWGSNQPKQLTWAQLSASAGWFASTVTTTSMAASRSAVGGWRCAAVMMESDASVTTTASTLDVPAAGSHTDVALAPAAADVLLSDWNVPPSETFDDDSAPIFPPVRARLPEIVGGNAAEESAEAMFAEIDRLLYAIQLHAALAV